MTTPGVCVGCRYCGATYRLGEAHQCQTYTPPRQAAGGKQYEVHPDDNGRWGIYEVGPGDLVPVAWFVREADAVWVRRMYEIVEEALARRPAEG